MGDGDLKLAWPQGGALSDNGMPGEGRGGVHEEDANKEVEDANKEEDEEGMTLC